MKLAYHICDVSAFVITELLSGGFSSSQPILVSMRESEVCDCAFLLAKSIRSLVHKSIAFYFQT